MSKPATQNCTAAENNSGAKANSDDTARNAPIGANDNPRPNTK